MTKTPVTPEGMAQFDGMDPVDAVVAAWTRPGRNPAWHRYKQVLVHDDMPLLARALGRLAQERAG